MLSSIAAGIIASFVFFLLGTLWKSHIYLWISSFRYAGINVSGGWIVEEHKQTAEGYELSVPTNLSVNLKQIANSLSGDAIAVIEQDGKKQYIHYRVEGNIKDRFIYLNCTLKENRRISHLSFLLEVLGNGEIMEGYMSFYALKAREMNAVKTKWKVLK